MEVCNVLLISEVHCFEKHWEEQGAGRRMRRQKKEEEEDEDFGGGGEEGGGRGGRYLGHSQNVCVIGVTLKKV